MKRLYKFFYDIFHICTMTNWTKVASSPEGEIWTYECDNCHRKSEALFNKERKCVSVKRIYPYD